MNIDIDSILTTVNDSLSRPTFQDQFLKCEVNNTYLVRILPYLKEGPGGVSKTFAFRRQYRWKEEIPGQKKPKWHYVTSASTKGEACPIHEWRDRFMELVEDKEERKRVLGPLSQNVSHICNVLVVDDPVNPKNNGKVMLLAMGKVLWDLVDNARKGNLDDEFSENFGREMKLGRAFLDPSDNGMNLSIKCLPNAMNLPTYDKSTFTLKKAQLGLTQEDLDRITSEMIDPVKSVNDEIKSYSAVKTEFYESFLAKADVTRYKGIVDAGVSTSIDVPKQVTKTDDDYEDFVPTRIESSHDEEDDDTTQDMKDFIASLAG